MSSWLGVAVVCLVIGVVIGLVTGFAGVEMSWWYFLVVGVLVATIASVWEAYSRRKKASSQTEVAEEAPEPQPKSGPPTG